MVEAFRMESPADQAARRRAQLVAVVAHLVVSRGVGEVSHASVAKRAGCARSLVYRYFPEREDLLYALLSSFEDELTERIAFDETVAGVLAMKDARRGSVPAATRVLFEKLWGPETWNGPELEFRLACVILMRDSSLRAVLGTHDAELQQSMENRLVAPLQGLGLSALEAGIVIDSMLSVMQHVTKAACAGEMTREHALDLFVSVNSRVIQTFMK